MVEAIFQDEVGIEEEEQPTWTLHVDGAVNAEGCGAGVVLTNHSQGVMTQIAISLLFQEKNKESEYEALIAGLELALTSPCTRLECFCDSEVVVNQVHGVYEARTGTLPQYHSRVMSLTPLFQQFVITAVPR